RLPVKPRQKKRRPVVAKSKRKQLKNKKQGHLSESWPIVEAPAWGFVLSEALFNCFFCRYNNALIR
ncbi:MAG TPA: hypothetical protein VLH77_02855, partial [Gammaproteobacteria bacterium]|nr:hypothetical protein [Gammaproteobacteria bacterium]